VPGMDLVHFPPRSLCCLASRANYKPPEDHKGSEECKEPLWPTWLLHRSCHLAPGMRFSVQRLTISVHPLCSRPPPTGKPRKAQQPEQAP
jgi:hypothetical protein